MRYCRSSAVLALLLCSTAAIAGETPLYESAPAWVLPAELPTSAAAKRNSLLVLDNQQRIEEGKLWVYTETAVRADNPQELNQVGTVTADWMPDKGDLIVHSVTILRGDEQIDALADGTKFEVIRREQQLENRILDGRLTATLNVPGLKINDVLRVRYSTTLSDQALGKEVQTVAYLPRTDQLKAGFARAMISWPKDAPVKWQIGPVAKLEGIAGAAPGPLASEGYDWLNVTLPLAKAPDLPGDAPGRYQMPALLMAGTFADWQEVSSTMAPHFATRGSITKGGPVMEQVERIKREHKGNEARALAALQLVQDEVSYLLNGMDGGNYIPQKPEETWTLRYGDCKAKTMLLLAMLREMGIEAEPLLVSATAGDSVAHLLPMASAFDHVIVRAVIGGKDFYLDGTDSGATRITLANVPPFYHGLPLREAGSGLIELTAKAPAVAEIATKIEVDYRAGIDLPALYQGELMVSGRSAASLRSMTEEMDLDKQRQFISSLAAVSVGSNSVSDFSITDRPDLDGVLIKVSGISMYEWTQDGALSQLAPPLPSATFNLQPDRARKAWKDIPVALPGPLTRELELSLIMPDKGRDAKPAGGGPVDMTIAGVKIERGYEIRDGVWKITDKVAFPGGELAPDAIAEAKAASQRFQAMGQLISVTRDAPRAWRFADGAGRSELAELERRYDKVVADDPEESGGRIGRAFFRLRTFDYEGAIEDYEHLSEMEPAPWIHLTMATIHANMGDYEAALEQTQAAYDLEPGPGHAMRLAFAMADVDDVEGGIALIEEQDGDKDMRRALLISRAELMSWNGQVAQATELIDAELAKAPQDAELLNNRCWMMGVWQHELDKTPELCTSAIERAENSGPALDSRAMAYFRLGRLDEALSDVNAALDIDPDQHPSLLLRGLIKRSQGKKDAEDDVRTALAREPSLKQRFSRYGFDLGK